MQALAPAVRRQRLRQGRSADPDHGTAAQPGHSAGILQQPLQLGRHQRDQRRPLAIEGGVFQKERRVSQPLRRQTTHGHPPLLGPHQGHQATDVVQRQGVEQLTVPRIEADAQEPFGRGCGRALQASQGLQAPAARAGTAAGSQHDSRAQAGWQGCLQ